MKTFALVICLAIISATAKSQVSYSESAIYVPRNNSESATSKDKKKDKKKDLVPPTEIPPVSNTIPMTVSVRDTNGNRIANLKKEDFKIFVGDKEAEIKSFEKSADPIDVILLIDTSPSASLKPDEVKRIAGMLADQFGNEDRIMVSEFNSRFKVLTDFTNDHVVIKKAIKELSMGDGTSLYDSVARLSTDFIQMTRNRTVVLIVTDGVDTTSRKENYSSSLGMVEKADVAVFPIYLDTFSAATSGPSSRALSPIAAIILGSSAASVPMGRPPTRDMQKAYEVGRLYLNDLVLATGGRAFTVPAFEAAPAEITRQVHERYFVTVQPSNGMKAGERYPIRVRVNIPNLAVIARGSYIAK